MPGKVTVAFLVRSAVDGMESPDVGGLVEAIRQRLDSEATSPLDLQDKPDYNIDDVIEMALEAGQLFRRAMKQGGQLSRKMTGFEDNIGRWGTTAPYDTYVVMMQEAYRALHSVVELYTTIQMEQPAIASQLEGRTGMKVQDFVRDRDIVMVALLETGNPIPDKNSYDGSLEWASEASLARYILAHMRDERSEQIKGQLGARHFPSGIRISDMVMDYDIKNEVRHVLEEATEAGRKFARSEGLGATAQQMLHIEHRVPFDIYGAYLQALGAASDALNILLRWHDEIIREQPTMAKMLGSESSYKPENFSRWQQITEKWLRNPALERREE